MALKINLMYVNKELEDFNRGLVQFPDLVNRIIAHFGVPRGTTAQYVKPLTQHLSASMDEEGKLNTNGIECGTAMGWLKEPVKTTPIGEQPPLQTEALKQIRLSVLNKMYGDPQGVGMVVKHIPDVGEEEVPSNQILSRIKPGDIVDLPDPQSESQYSFFKVLPDLAVQGESVNKHMQVKTQTPYKQFIYHVTENDFNKANKAIEKIFEDKLRQRINNTLKRVDEGLFDRLGAKTAGLGAGLKAKAQNAVTRGTSAVKAVGQNVVGAVTGQGFQAGQNTVNAATAQIDANNPVKRAKAAKANSLIGSIEKDLSTLYPDVNVKKALVNLRAQLNFSKA